MLENAADVARRAAAELDDPSQSQFDFAYLQPFIDTEYDMLANQLEAMGMAYQERVAVFNVAAGTVDLSALQAVGGAMQYMKLPTRLKWKVQGTPDTTYAVGEFMDPSSLPEVGSNAVGITAWAWNGAIQCVPSTLALTVKLWYQVLSTTITDPQTGTVQGTAHILAFRVAATVANIRGMTMEARIDRRSTSAWNTFAVILAKLNQSKKIVPKKFHGIRRKVSPVGLM